MGKALALIALLAIMWAVNYFVVCLVGLCFGITVTSSLQATGVLVALLWIRIVCGGDI